MATRIWQKKLVPEELNVETDMEDRLLVGETIDSVSCEIVVWSGVDAAPAAMLSGTTTFDGSVISQKVIDGEPGVIYKLLFSANTSLANLLINEVKLAVLSVSTDAL